MSDSHELHLQHHYRDMEQQHDAAKLGIWLFLATEILLFGGLFCGYAVFRANHEDLFVWGEQFLDERYGAANTAVLLISSLTMAMAITYVQQEKKRAALVTLGITFVCAGIFMAIKSVEYEHKFHDHLLGGMAFYQTSDHGDDTGGDHAAVLIEHGDIVNGELIWNASCRSCHGATGEGVPGQGVPLDDNAYVRNHSDKELVTLVTDGRTASDPETTLFLDMPPKGGNPMLKEQQIIDVVAYMRTLEIPPGPEGHIEATSSHVVTSMPNATSTVVPLIDDLPRSTIPNANQAATGLAPDSASQAQRMAVYVRPEVPQLDEHRPANAHLFFGLYFLMTGLHGVHVVIGMIVLLWLMWRVQRGDFTKRHYAAVECGGLYWHVVDVIWIFLFPLWYLIA
ncbi:MAG: cytochrome c oxidase subunit 3 [Phycisphaerales bacterium]|jgi:cytochrome c oxidase subunit 3